MTKTSDRAEARQLISAARRSLRDDEDAPSPARRERAQVLATLALALATLALEP